MSDWYARKLAELQGRQAPPPPGPPQYPATQPLAPGQLPPHLAPYAVPPAPAQYAAQPQPGNGQYGPQGTPQAPPPQHPQQQFTSYDANTGAQVADDGTIAALVMAAQTGGSREVQQGSSSCPNCGGGNYFTITGKGTFSRAAGGVVHAMQCADCNYPQVQAGSHGGALQGARSGGPAKAARQLPAGHRVSVVDEGGRTVTFDPPTGR